MEQGCCELGTHALAERELADRLGQQRLESQQGDELVAATTIALGRYPVDVGQKIEAVEDGQVPPELAALLHDPEILFLDEPTIGLDVISKGRLREFLRALNASRGTTLVLTTHDLQDIEALCDRVIVIDHGTCVFDGELAELHRHGGSTRTLVVDLVDEAPAIRVPGADTLRVEGPRQWLAFPADASAAPIVAAVAAAYDVADLSIQEPDIEDVIRELYSR